jgi:crotonobetainyl-CoA:carnitine CoA-transferase CaiB-like acyl-CoA transferase
MLESCLAGVCVLDVSQWLPGPHAALVMADLGADVIKIEPPTGDPMRTMAPADADGVSAEYNATNGGKRVLRLDLKSAAGAETFRRLAARADVLMESYRPGVLGRLGFSPEALRELNPRLIHTALTGWGWTGPSAQRAGHDINYLAVGGGLAYSGAPERPSLMRAPVADYASALTAVIATLAALQRRNATGEGGFVDVSLMESVLAWQAELFIADRHGMAGRRGEAMLTGGAAYYNVYRTSDGEFVTLGAIEPKFWQAFCRAVERPDWIGRQDEAIPQTELIAEVAALFATRTRAAWRALLEPVDCCFEAVLSAKGTRTHPQIAARGLVRESAGRVEVLFPAHLDGQPPKPRAAVKEIDAAAALRSWSR